MATPTLVQKAKNSNVYPTSPLQVVLPAAATAGNTIVIAVEASKILDPFSVSGLNAATSNPVVKDNLGNTYTAAQTQKNFDGDLAFWGSLYLYFAANVAGGNRTFTLTNLDGNGRPTFNHGVNMQVYEFNGLTTTPNDGSASAFVTGQTTSGAGNINLTVSGDLVFSVIYMEKGAAMTLPSGFTLLDSDRIIGTGADYFTTAYMNGNVTSRSATITNVALTTNVVTITAANTFNVGAVVKLSGLTTATFLNNQTLTVTASNGTTFTAAFTHADYTSAADTGTAVGGPALLPTGNYNPTFGNQNGNECVVATLALKHS